MFACTCICYCVANSLKCSIDLAQLSLNLLLLCYSSRHLRALQNKFFASCGKYVWKYLKAFGKENCIPVSVIILNAFVWLKGYDSESKSRCILLASWIPREHTESLISPNQNIFQGGYNSDPSHLSCK